MEPSQVRVTRAVQNHLKAHSLSQSDLARQIGLSALAFNRRIHGNVKWSLDDIDMLTLAGVEMPWLVLDAEAVAQ